MYKRSFWLVPVLLLGGGLWWLQAAVPAPPVVSAPTITPNLVIVNTPTALTATVHIPDPTLNPANVELIKINASGASTVVAQMVDNGQNGDQKPGDKVFTAQFTLNESQLGRLGFQVSAAFRGQMRRTLSSVLPFVTLAPITIPVVLPPDPGEAGKATLQGIDSDGDGVRDDIQRYIIFTYPNSEKTRTAFEQFARSYQVRLTDSTGQTSTAVQNALANGKALDCLSYVTSPGDVHRMLEDLQPLLVNTEMRLKALWQIERRLSGTVFPLSSLSERKAACAFNPDIMPNWVWLL